MERNSRALIVTGGSLVDGLNARVLGSFGVVIAADSGVDTAHALGIDPDVVIGDLDSVSDAALDHARNAGATVIPAPRDKDFTDTELAIAHAVSLGASALLVVNGGGGRLDHAHGVLTALANPHHAHVAIEAIVGGAHVTVIHGGSSRTIPLRGSDIVGLHAMNGPAVGITTSGMRWNLNDDTLEPWVSRGVSNEMTEQSADITLRTGALIVVQPHAYDNVQPHAYTFEES